MSKDSESPFLANDLRILSRKNKGNQERRWQRLGTWDEKILPILDRGHTDIYFYRYNSHSIKLFLKNGESRSRCKGSRRGSLGRKDHLLKESMIEKVEKAHCTGEEMRTTTRNFQENTESGPGKPRAVLGTAIIWHVISTRANELSDNRCHQTMMVACAPHTEIKLHQAGRWNSSRQLYSTLSNAM